MKEKNDQLNPAIYQRLFVFGKRLLTEKDVNKLLTIAMDMAIEISNAERGWVILYEDTNQEILFQTARNLLKEDIEPPDFEISRTVIERVKTDGKTVFLQNILDDPSLIQSQNMDGLKKLSVICLPLKQEERVFGIFYLDNQQRAHMFTHETFIFIQEFAKFISTAAYSLLEQKQLQNLVSNLEKAIKKT